MKLKPILITLVSLNIFAFNSIKGVNISPDRRDSVNIVSQVGERVVLTGKICELRPSFKSKIPKCESLNTKKYKLRASFPDFAVDITKDVKIKKTNKGWFYTYETPDLRDEDKNQFEIVIDKVGRPVKGLRILKAKIEKRILYIEKILSKFKNKKSKNRLENFLVFLKGIQKRIESKLNVQNTAYARVVETVKVNGVRERKLFHSTTQANIQSIVSIKSNPIYKMEKLEGQVSFKVLDKLNANSKYDIAIYLDDQLTKEIKNIKKGELDNLVIPLTDIDSFNAKYLKIRISRAILGKFQHKLLEQTISLYSLEDEVAPEWISLNRFLVNDKELVVELKDSFGDLDYESTLFFLTNGEDKKFLQSNVISHKTNSIVYKLEPTDFLRGKNTLVLSGKDLAGNIAKKEIEVVIDTISPIVEIASEIPVQTKEKSIDLILKVADTSDVRISIFNNDELIAEELNKYSYTLPLVEGSNHLRVSVEDIYGNKADDIITTVLVDSIAPTFGIISPLPNFTNLDSLNIAFEATDANTVSYSIKQNENLIQLNSLTSYDISLVEGINKIELIATDDLGNFTEVSIGSVVKDTVAPILNLISDLPNITKVRTQIVNFNVDDNNLDSFKLILNNKQIENITIGLNTLILMEGTNTVRLEAHDKAGNLSFLEREVIVDTVAPIVEVLSTIPSRTNIPQLSVQTNISDERLKSAGVNINGISRTLDITNLDSIIIDLKEGQNSIVFFAEDSASNQTSTHQYDVNLDTVPASLLSVTPKSGSSIEGLAFDIVMKFDETVYDININNDLIDSGKSEVSHRLEEQSYGLKEYIVSFTDDSGNTSSSSYLINLIENSNDDSLNIIASLSAPEIEVNSVLRIDFSETLADSPIKKYSVKINNTLVNSTTPIVELSPSVVGTFPVVLTVETDKGSRNLEKEVTVHPIPKTSKSAEEVISEMPVKSTEDKESEGFAQRNSFLFFGDDPIQKGITISNEEKKVSGITVGVVKDDLGNGVSGVKVTVLKKDGFGHTYSDSEGKFSMMIPAGEESVVTFERVGYIKSQRSLRLTSAEIGNPLTINLVKVSSKATEVKFGTTDSTIAYGEEVIDSRGKREVFTAFQPGTEATIVLKDGTTKTLDSGTVRFTEFTQGNSGQERMPGSLPVTSEYTFAFEASFDEATLLDAKSVRFNKPVYTYVTNFLNLPTGAIVPAGYYDREIGRWVGEDNGLVVKIVGKNEQGVKVAVSQDEAALGSDELALLNFSSNELKNLADRFKVGDSFWRVPINHFTPWDFNFPRYAVIDEDNPEPVMNNDSFGNKVDSVAGVNNNSLSCGSVIDVENQNLLEFIPIDGTGLELKYESRLSSSISSLITRSFSTDISNSNKATMVIAGQTIDAMIEGDNISGSWDGRDRWGNTLYGPQKAQVSIKTYDNPVSYSMCVPKNLSDAFDDGVVRAGNMRSLFGANGAVTAEECIAMGFALVGATSEIPKTHTFETIVDSPNKPTLLKGIKDWTLSNVHKIQYGVFFSGDGQKRNGRALIPNALDVKSTPHVNTKLMSYGPTGELYYVDIYNKIIKRELDGTEVEISTLSGITHLKFGADGMLYGRTNSGIHNLSRNEAVLESIRGDYNFCGQYVHNLAKAGGSKFNWLNDEHKCSSPTDFAVSNDGSLYLMFIARDVKFYARMDKEKNIHFSLGVSQVEGRINKLIFGDWASMSVSGKTLGDNVRDIYDGIEHDFNNSIYIPALFADTGKYSLLEIKEENEVKRYLSGNDTNEYYVPGRYVFSNDEVGGISPMMFKATKDHIILSMRKGLFIIDKEKEEINTLSSFVNTNRIVEGANLYLTGTTIENANVAFHSPDKFVMPTSYGKIVEVTGGYGVPVMVSPEVIVAKYGEGITTVPDTTRNEAYVFSSVGIHLATYFLDTLKPKFEMMYSQDNYLEKIVDQFGNSTDLKYGTNNKVNKIVAPGGFSTNLGVVDSGELVSLTQGNDLYLMEYTANGLLSKFTDPIGKTAEFFFNENKLVLDRNNFGNQVKITKNELDSEKNEYIEESALGRKKVHSHTDLGFGNSHKIVTLPNGVQSESIYIEGEYEYHLDASGFEFEKSYGPNPHVDNNTSYITALGVNLPNNKNLLYTQEKKKVLDSSGELQAFESKVTENGDVWTIINDIKTNIKTVTSPHGRVSKSYYNDKGNLVKVEQGAVSITNSYDSKGLLTNSSDGVNQTIINYNSNLLPDSISVNGEKDLFEYDSRGRVSKRTDENGRGVELSYDGKGNILTVKPLNGNEHSFMNTILGFAKEYISPSIGGEVFSTKYDYSVDNELTKVTYPSGKILNLTYGETTGDLENVVWSKDSISYGYNIAGQVNSLSSTNGQSTTASYNGYQVTSVESLGEISGKLDFEYESKGQLDKIKLNNVLLSDYSFDKDKLISGVLLGNGQSVVVNIGQDYLLNNLTHGDFTEDYTYGNNGRLSGYTIKKNGIILHEQSYDYEKGRISKRIIDGAENLYGYDKSGQLVRDNSVTYSWDSNGNPLGATVDVQDRLTDNGGHSLTYNKDGNVVEISNSAENYTLKLEVDERSILRRAEVNGKVIDYVIDPSGRRVGKKISGVLAEGYIYKDQLNPIAKVNAQGSVLQSYTYLDKSHVPAFMEANGKLYRYITDQLGSVIAVMDTATGLFIQKLTYDAFGKVLSDTNPGFQPFGFAGGLYDQDTKLVRFGARDYNPEIGRWMQKDPIGFAGGDTNLYRYVGNNPVNFIDPRGTDTVAVGFSGTFSGFGFSGTAGFQFVKDDKGNTGISFTGGVGAGGAIPNGAITADFTKTNANTISDLGGPGFQAGGSVTVGAPLGVAFGGEVTGGNGFIGGTGSIGIGSAGAGAFVIPTATKIVPFGQTVGGSCGAK